MKLHHIGIVCQEKEINEFYFKPKKKFIYKDRKQNNKIILEYNNLNKLWMEFIIPMNKKSTVINFINKYGSSIHHFAYFTNNLPKIKKQLHKKKGFTYVNSFKINIPCFGGKLDTVFYYNNNIFIEFLTNARN